MNRVKPSRIHNLGFNLVELMVGLALGTILISGLISIYVSTLVSGGSTMKSSKLSQQMSALMSVITNDVRRAGYWGQGAISDEDFLSRDLFTNPFNTVDISALALIDSIASNTIITGNGADTGECLVYTYDANNDAVLDDQDILGFRLNGSIAQMRRLGDADDARYDTCTTGTWENLNDSNVISVDSLTFSLSNSTCINTREPDEVDNDGMNGIDDAAEADCYTVLPVAGSGDITTETLQITINLTASLVNDPFVQSSMTQIVRVRNDRVRQW